MFDLFKSELRRYLPFALGLMVLHLAVWGFIYTQKPLLEFGNEEIIGTFMFSCGMGIAFGLLQLALHRNKNRWAFLVHRPMSLFQIHSSLFGAGALLLHIGVVIPFMLMMWAMDNFTNEVVEWRHYVFVVHMSLVTLSGYALGIWICLSANKGAFIGFGFIVMVMTDGAYSPSLLLMLELLIFIAFYTLSLRAFKANLGQHEQSKAHIALAVLVMQPLLAGFLWVSQGLFYQLPVALFADHGKRLETAEFRQTLSIVFQLKTHQFLEEILKDSDYADKQSLLKQAELAHEKHFRTGNESMPLRGQPFFLDGQYSLEDKNTGNRWVLSHNSMVLQGIDKDGQIVGYLGKQGFMDKTASIAETDRFEHVPVLLQGRYIKTPNQLLMVDFTQKHLSTKFTLPKGEQFINGLQFDNKIQLALLISDKAIYTFDARQMREYDELAEPLHRVAHYKPMIEQPFSSYIELVDGYLFTFYGFNYFGHNKPATALVYARHDGSVEIIGEKAFKKPRPEPTILSYMDFWVSPLVNGYFISYIKGLFQPELSYKYVTQDNVTKRHYPQEIIIWILFMAAICTTIAVIVGRKIGLSRSQLAFWAGVNLICGLTGLVSFLLMNRWWGFWRAPVTKPVKV